MAEHLVFFSRVLLFFFPGFKGHVLISGEFRVIMICPRNNSTLEIERMNTEKKMIGLFA